MSGCGSTQVGRQYDFHEPNAVVSSNIGYLKIYTVTHLEKGEYADDPTYKIFKGYTIYDGNGEHIREVERSYQEPEVVKLKEGEYIVLAELHKNIIHSFQLKIEKGKIIEIDESMVENPLAISQKY
jgi:hypothetical protein